MTTAVRQPDDANDGPSPHVVHIVDGGVLDRVGRLFRHTVLALNAEGLRITVVTDDRAVVGDLDGTPIDCRRVMTLRGMRAWTVARQIARFERPLVVHVWGTACWRSLGERALRFGLPVVVHALSMRDVERLAQRHLPPGVRVAVASGPLQKAYLERAGEHPVRAVAIPPAFLMPDAPADELEALPENTMSVVWSGQITAQAGLNTLIDAVAQLREKGHELQLALIGTGPADRHVWEHMRRANVIDCVSLVYDARLWDQSMRGVHVCVVPARQSELSLAPLLAMAYGRVVISSRDQIAEWFVEDVTTWQFTPGSAVELAYHLSRVAEGNRRGRELGETAAAYVREQHKIGAWLPALIGLYREAVVERENLIAMETGGS